MSNEVIIDGVNVAECEFLGKYNVCKAYVYMPKSCGCDYNPDCYFKQLQRAKAENERLSELTCVNCGEKFLSPTGSELYEKIVQLKAENEKLDEELRTYKKYKFLFEKARELYLEGKEWAKKCQAENEDLKDSLKRTVCQAECFRYKEAEKYKAENEKLKEWLENKEKAYSHLCNANNRKKEQIKNLNYMLFEEKEMTTKEWKLKYRLANKDRKFIQYKEIANKKLNDYKQALKDIREDMEKDTTCESRECGCDDYAECINCMKETIINRINEVLNNE